jgi:menaquinone-dependent protoporphyrinogen oxidase
MKVLVAYASAHHSTAGIAIEIADRLRRAGLEADVRALHDVGALDGYDAVVLGSALHHQSWLPPAAAFARAHAADLGRRPLWLFSVGAVGATSSVLGPAATRFIRRRRRDTGELAALRQALRPRDHRYFAGAVERSHWNLAGDLFMRISRGRYGDHRDWRDVGAWADAIALQLLAADDGGERRDPVAAGRDAHPCG